MEQEYYLCDTDAFTNKNSRGFTVEGIELFVVHQQGQYYSYRNSCPHIQVRLDWLEDQFLTTDKDFILCANHGALFQIKDGRCISGPCQGTALEQLPLIQKEQRLYVRLTPQNT